MKVKVVLVTTLVALDPTHTPIVVGLEIGNLFGFTENNYQSPFQTDMSTVKQDAFSEGSSNPSKGDLIAQGDSGGGKGKGGKGRYPKLPKGHDENDECCTCNCFDLDDTDDRDDYMYTNDEDDGYKYGIHDDEQFCHCSCSCGSRGGAMPIIPTVNPTPSPRPSPIVEPTVAPMAPPTASPTELTESPIVNNPTASPTLSPVVEPTVAPMVSPTASPTESPTSSPTASPTVSPTTAPTESPPPPEPCLIEVEIDCATTSGALCADLDPPSSIQCADGSSFDVILFSFQECTCAESENNQGDEAACADSASLPSDEVTVSCEDTATEMELSVIPTMVDPGGIFSVSSAGGGPLPVKITCFVAEQNGNRIQTNVIDVSGNVPLNLGDKFGALQVEGCDDLSCLEELCNSIEIENVGTNPLDIILVDFTFNGETISLLRSVPTTTLFPGESTRVEEKRSINTCVAQELCAEVEVEGDPPEGGQVCQDQDEFKFSIDPIPPPPPTASPTASPTSSPDESCIIDIEATCVVGGETSSSMDCSVPMIGVEQCTTRPTEATMLFNGGDCSQSFNNQGDRFTCTDFGDGPPTELEDEVHILVTDAIDGRTIYFDGVVSLGDFYRLNDGGNRFVADQNITISTPDEATVLQEVAYSFACSQNVFLKDQFGASQIVGFFNAVQGNVTCFQTFEFSLNISVPINSAGDNVTLTSFVAMTNFAGTIDLTDQVAGQTVGPGGNFVVTLSGTVDVSTRQRYFLMFTIAGTRNPDGTSCSGMDTLDFDAGFQAPTPPPVPVPPMGPLP